jgi:Asp-tRNA(Asn)/Glu-tRNA(Gln) amidotransferase B subunit
MCEVRERNKTNLSAQERKANTEVSRKRCPSLICSSMPELPCATRERLLAQGLSAQDMDVLTTADAGREVGIDGVSGRGGVVAYFDAVSEGWDPKIVVNWIVQVLFVQLAARNQTFSENPITVAQLGPLIDMVRSSVITGDLFPRNVCRVTVHLTAVLHRIFRKADSEAHVG